MKKNKRQAQNFWKQIFFLFFFIFPIQKGFSATVVLSMSFNNQTEDFQFYIKNSPKLFTQNHPFAVLEKNFFQIPTNAPFQGQKDSIEYYTNKALSRLQKFFKKNPKQLQQLFFSFVAHGDEYFICRKKQPDISYKDLFQMIFDKIDQHPLLKEHLIVTFFVSTCYAESALTGLKARILANPFLSKKTFQNKTDSNRYRYRVFLITSSKKNEPCLGSTRHRLTLFRNIMFSIKDKNNFGDYFFNAIGNIQDSPIHQTSYFAHCPHLLQNKKNCITCFLKKNGRLIKVCGLMATHTIFSSFEKIDNKLQKKDAYFLMRKILYVIQNIYYRYSAISYFQKIGNQNPHFLLEVLDDVFGNKKILWNPSVIHHDHSNMSMDHIKKNLIYAIYETSCWKESDDILEDHVFPWSSKFSKEVLKKVLYYTKRTSFKDQSTINYWRRSLICLAYRSKLSRLYLKKLEKMIRISLSHQKDKGVSKLGNALLSRLKKEKPHVK